MKQGSLSGVDAYTAGSDQRARQRRTPLSFITAGALILSALTFSALPVTPVSATDQEWAALADGTSNAVWALDIASNGNVVAGGWFPTASGVTVNRIAQWDGDSWSPLGSGFTNLVDTISIAADGTVYAGGYFADVGEPQHIARWNGTTWSALGTGMNNDVYATAIGPDGSLYAGGVFTDAGGVANTSYIAKWDGTAWSALGTGMNGLVYSLAIGPDGSLYAGGNFTTAGGTPANRIARWNGTTWNALGSGMSSGVDALAIRDDGTVIAGGFFTTAGGVAASRIAQWDGTAWSAFGSGMDDDVNALAIGSDGTLFAGGTFLTAGGTAVNRIAQWDGTRWAALSTGVNNQVVTLAIAPNGTLYAGGEFTTAGAVSARHIASWPPLARTSNASTASFADFQYFLPDGRECASISPQRVQVGTMVELPGVDALCKTMPGSVVAGWTIPVPPGFTGAGSSSLPFNPGHRVRVIESQRFTLVPFDPVIQIDYDANIAADDSCTALDIAHGSENGRVGYAWVPRVDFAIARTAMAAPCVPDGYELIGWNTRGDGSGQSLGVGDRLPDAWESQAVNHHRLYAMWRLV